jgi:hypothetical protein
MNMILYRLLREIQLQRNFFICETAANHLNQLLFPARESQIVFDYKARRGRFLIRHQLK